MSPRKMFVCGTALLGAVLMFTGGCCRPAHAKQRCGPCPQKPCAARPACHEQPAPPPARPEPPVAQAPCPQPPPPPTDPGRACDGCQPTIQMPPYRVADVHLPDQHHVQHIYQKDIVTQIYHREVEVHRCGDCKLNEQGSACDACRQKTGD